MSRIAIIVLVIIYFNNCKIKDKMNPKNSEKPKDEKVISDEEKSKHQEIIDYWTEQRMKNAIPVEVEIDSVQKDSVKKKRKKPPN